MNTSGDLVIPSCHNCPILHPMTDRAIHSYYQIRVKGHLDLVWSDWFDNMTILHASDGNTTLCGPVVDQAALYGLIDRSRDLGLTLLGVWLCGET